MKEAGSRIVIDKLLRESGWVLPGDENKPNVEPELTNKKGAADYVLMDSKGFPLCVIEAKRDLKSPLDGKEQARGYADSLNCRFIILSNGVNHYQWDLEQGSPFIIDKFPPQKQLELRKTKFNPPTYEDEPISENYIGLTQYPDFEKDPDYLDATQKEDFLSKNKIRLLRDYQLNAVHAVQKSIKNGRDRFLLEMATGTGKTLTSCAIIKMFLRLYKVNRVLFLVDRLELESQAKKEFDEVLKNDFKTVVWKENQSDWKKAEIVVSTVQSFVSKNKYKKVFEHDDFDLVISDEAHRSLGARSRRVFEYFNGFKLGLTATPRNFLKSLDIEMLGEKDPRSLEQRFILDTYMTFGCESSEPTFRYSLEDGVKDGHLVNPKVFDARTEITTELLSDKGYIFQGVDEDGNDIEETFLRRDFEKRFFSETTNTIFCETFLQKAKRDPYTNEIGKTLIFCVSQTHASKITQILNLLADKAFPNQYRSDFAVQVTSGIEDSQRMTIDFRSNNLNGQSKVNENYRTSKTRVCVTVGMMTTGYDCTDLLNLCMMRPVYSPSEFIQMKGRGTRKNNFMSHWMSGELVPKHISSVKEDFYLFDFFGNYEYFEKYFDYDEILKLPKKPSIPIDGPTTIDVDKLTNYDEDPLKFIDEIKISNEGMKIDRDLYKSCQSKIQSNKAIIELVKNLEFDEAEKYLKENIFDRPDDFINLSRLGQSIGLDRKLTTAEFLLHTFGHLERIKGKQECLQEDFDNLSDEINVSDEFYYDARQFFDSYVADPNFRNVINSEKFAELSLHPTGQSFKNLPDQLREQIPLFVKEKVNLDRFENA